MLFVMPTLRLDQGDTQCSLFRYGTKCNQAFRGMEEMKDMIRGHRSADESVNLDSRIMYRSVR